MNRPFYRTDEAAPLLSMSRSRLRALRDAGSGLKYCLLNGKAVYRRTVVHAFLRGGPNAANCTIPGPEWTPEVIE